MRIRLHCPRPTKGGMALVRAMGIKRLRRGLSRFVPRQGDVIINWGDTSHTPAEFLPCHILNPADAVERAANKLTAIRLMDEANVCVPLWTTEQARAQRWVDKGKIVVVRRLLRAGEGRGIGLVGQEIRDGDHTGVVGTAPLYTLYRPKKDEYRVHVVNGKVVDYAQKKRQRTENRWDGCSQIRNTHHGWIYARCEVKPPAEVCHQAVLAVRALGLDFGSADVGYTEKSSKATVYEVNTAPGLHGTTLKRFSDAMKDMIDERFTGQ